MPQGLQVWDAAGNLKLDVSTALTRVLGAFDTPIFQPTASSGAVSGSITDPSLLLGKPFFLCRRGPGYQNYGTLVPHVTFSGDTLNWIFPQVEVRAWFFFNSYGYNNFKVQATIIYGIY